MRSFSRTCASAIVAALLAACADDPVAVEQEEARQSVAQGAYHTCKLAASGAALCRGANRQGQLGTGDLVDRAEFTPVAGGLSFAQIDAADENTCGITGAGLLYCWGKNSEFEVRPVGATAPVSAPELIASGRTFKKVSVGHHEAICALGTDDVVYCWGHNDQGQVGRAPLAQRDSARAPVTASRRFRDLAVAGIGGCGVATDGDTYCWGRDGRTGTYGDPPLPALIPGGRKFTSISAGLLAFCGLEGGAAYCWGEGAEGLVTGMVAPYNLPRPVPGNVAFASISVGDGRACGLTTAGALHCWSSSIPVPARVAPERTFRAMDSSWGVTAFCAIADDGETYCF